MITKHTQEHAVSASSVSLASMLTYNGTSNTGSWNWEQRKAQPKQRKSSNSHSNKYKGVKSNSNNSNRADRYILLNTVSIALLVLRLLEMYCSTMVIPVHCWISTSPNCHTNLWSLAHALCCMTGRTIEYSLLSDRPTCERTPTHGCSRVAT